MFIVQNLPRFGNALIDPGHFFCFFVYEINKSGRVILLRNVGNCLTQSNSISVVGQNGSLNRQLIEMKRTFYNIRNIDGQAIGTINELKQDAQIKIWLQRCGLTMNDLNNHPYIEDITFLLEIRREFQQEMIINKSYMGTFSAYWDIVVNKQKPLKDKAFKKFEQVVLGCILLRRQQEYKINKIKSLRQHQGN